MEKYNRFAKVLATAMILIGLAVALISSPVEAQKTKPRKTAKKTAVKKTAKTTAGLPAPKNAVEQGYLAGYNDGFVSGKTDYNTNTSKDYQRSTLYQEANRGYEKSYGELADFQRGYKAGYEIAYNDGYTGRDKNLQFPSNLEALTKPENNSGQQTMQRTDEAGKEKAVNKKPPITIAPDTSFRLRLEDQVSTKTNQSGDRFKAVVVEPKEFEGATIEGHISDIKRAGKLTGQTQLALDFDFIVFSDGSRAPFHAQVERVYATEKVKTIDEEGNVQTGSTTKDTTVRSAGGAALGAIIGAVAGGGKGAAIGAILGATVGAGSVYVQGNKDLIFDPGTEIQVRTIGPKR